MDLLLHCPFSYTLLSLFWPKPLDLHISTVTSLFDKVGRRARLIDPFWWRFFPLLLFSFASTFTTHNLSFLILSKIRCWVYLVWWISHRLILYLSMFTLLRHITLYFSFSFSFIICDSNCTQTTWFIIFIFTDLSSCILTFLTCASFNPFISWFTFLLFL